MNQPSTPSSFPDSATHYNPDLQSPLSHRSASNQVTRRAPRQDLAQPQRASYTNGNTDGWPALADDGMQQLGDGVWGNNGDDLDQKALIAQKDAQAKRKQIPPFVQKLSRRVSPVIVNNASC